VKNDSAKRTRVPRYVAGREQQAPKLPPTPAQQNAAAREFWDRESARLERQAKNHPGEISAAADLAARLVKHGHISDVDFAGETSVNGRTQTLERARVRERTAARQRTQKARKRLASAVREKGSRHSAQVRADATRERDRHIHDAHARGTKVKKIAGDAAIIGDEKISESQVRRILNKPRP
jgi:hypothetical protein